MIDKQKQILLKELCCRLPYGVICNVPFKKAEQKLLGIIETDLNDIRLIFDKGGDLVRECYLSEVKPYLRPMSSMTEKEMSELRQWGSLCMTPNGCVEDVGAYCVEDVGVYGAIHSIPVIDWLNAHHFDYRGLIGMGIALPAPEGMYNFK